MLTRKGFTLVEMMFVLSITLTLSMLSMKIHVPNGNVDTSVERITQFFNEAKMNAIVYKEKTTISLAGNKLSYTSSTHQKTIAITNGTVNSSKTFSYNAKGNIYRASTIKYTIEGSPVSFVFQVGSGCFDVR